MPVEIIGHTTFVGTSGVESTLTPIATSVIQTESGAAYGGLEAATYVQALQDGMTESQADIAAFYAGREERVRVEQALLDGKGR